MAIASRPSSTELAGSRLIAEARRAGRLPNLLVVLVMAVVLVVGSQTVGGLLLAALFQFGFGLSSLDPTRVSDTALGSGLALAALLVAGFLPLFGLLWLWVTRFERRPFATLGYATPRPLREYLRGLLVGLAMLSAAVGILTALGYTAEETGRPGMQGTAALGGVLVVLIGWVVQGASEEILSRGWMLPVVGARYGLGLGLLVSSLFFAFGHAINPNVTPIALANLALYGLFAALYALREGGIWGISGQHTAWNWAQANLFGLQVSGIESGGGSLLNLAENGPDPITGGAFGPEGGLAITAVLLATIALLWFGRRARGGVRPD